MNWNLRWDSCKHFQSSFYFSCTMVSFHSLGEFQLSDESSTKKIHKKKITHSQLRLQSFILQYQQPEHYQCCPVTLCVSENSAQVLWLVFAPGNLHWTSMSPLSPLKCWSLTVTLTVPFASSVTYRGEKIIHINCTRLKWVKTDFTHLSQK